MSAGPEVTTFPLRRGACAGGRTRYLQLIGWVLTNIGGLVLLGRVFGRGGG